MNIKDIKDMKLPHVLKSHKGKYFLTMEWTDTMIFIRYQASYHEDMDVLSMWAKVDKMDRLLCEVAEQVKELVDTGIVSVVE